MSDNKQTAHKLKEVLKSKGYDIKLCQVYDVLSELHGFKTIM